MTPPPTEKPAARIEKIDAAETHEDVRRGRQGRARATAAKEPGAIAVAPDAAESIAIPSRPPSRRRPAARKRAATCRPPRSPPADDAAAVGGRRSPTIPPGFAAARDHAGGGACRRPAARIPQLGDAAAVRRAVRPPAIVTRETDDGVRSSDRARRRGHAAARRSRRASDPTRKQSLPVPMLEQRESVAESDEEASSAEPERSRGAPASDRRGRRGRHRGRDRARAAGAHAASLGIAKKKPRRMTAAPRSRARRARACGARQHRRAAHRRSRARRDRARRGCREARASTTRPRVHYKRRDRRGDDAEEHRRGRTTSSPRRSRRGARSPRRSTQLEAAVAATARRSDRVADLGIVRHKQRRLPARSRHSRSAKALAPRDARPRIAPRGAALEQPAHRPQALAEYKALLELDLPDRVREKVRVGRIEPSCEPSRDILRGMRRVAVLPAPARAGAARADHFDWAGQVELDAEGLQSDDPKKRLDAVALLGMRRHPPRAAVPDEGARPTRTSACATRPRRRSAPAARTVAVPAMIEWLCDVDREDAARSPPTCSATSAAPRPPRRSRARSAMPMLRFASAR